MPMLDYNALQSLVDLENSHHLEFVNVDVRRLHDDRADIQYGDEIALVASFTAKITAAGARRIKRHEGCGDISAGDKLFVVSTDAEVRSEVVELENEHVIRWIADHYDFIFLLNGREHGSFREVTRTPGAVEPAPPAPVQSPTGAAGFPGATTGSNPVNVAPSARLAPGSTTMVATTTETTTRQLGLTRYPVGRDVVRENHHRDFGLPWLRRLNTAALNDDLIDVDVRIVERVPTVAKSALKTTLLLNKANIPLAFDNDPQFEIKLEVEGKYALAGELHNKVFRLPLRADEGPDVQLVLTVISVGDAVTPIPSQANKKAKHH